MELKEKNIERNKKKGNKRKKITFVKCSKLFNNTDKMIEGKKYRLLNTKMVENKLRYLILDENNEKFSFVPSEQGEFGLETLN